MRFALMQPYFFPYLGYFRLIARVDRWIAFDTAQYTPQSWMNRNRIIAAETGWRFLTVPVKRAPQATPINEVRLADPKHLQSMVLGMLSPYRGHAPHYMAVRDVVAAGIASAKSDRLADLNMATLKAVCDFMGVRFDAERLSEMDLGMATVTRPGDWALQVALAIGADSYLNAPGGTALFSQPDWDAKGIKLEFCEVSHLAYDCGRYPFVPNLSIIDVLMWNSRERIREHLYSGEMSPSNSPAR